MRGCVIGAGPSGLYTAKYLANQGIPITIYEKSNEILGNYKYAITKGNGLNEIASNKNIELKLNADSSQIDDREYDFYVVATGGVPRRLNIEGEEACIGGLEVVQMYYKNNLPDLGDRVCIIGMGNVAFDIIRYIYGKCKDITVLSNRNYLESPFDNHILREIVDDDRWSINETNNLAENQNEVSLLPRQKDKRIESIPSDVQNITGRKSLRRMQIFQDIIRNQVKNMKSYFSNTKTTVSLLFNTSLEKIIKNNSKVKIAYRNGDKLNEELFDNVVISIGFVPNPAFISTNKPIFYTGWCVNPRGNINDAQHDAKICAEDIIRSLYNNCKGTYLL